METFSDIPGVVFVEDPNQAIAYIGALFVGTLAVFLLQTCFVVMVLLCMCCRARTPVVLETKVSFVEVEEEPPQAPIRLPRRHLHKAPRDELLAPPVVPSGVDNLESSRMSTGSSSTIEESDDDMRE